MTQRSQGASPIVRAVTGFDADQARCDLREIRLDVGPPETFLNHRISAIVDAMHLEYVFRDVEADGPDRHAVLLVGSAVCRLPEQESIPSASQ
jgi:hypothetical protein